jgi:hypothetical protein
MFRALLAPTIVLVLIAAGCGDDDTLSPGSGQETSPTATPSPETLEAQLDAARALWADNGFASYYLTTVEVCFCFGPSWTDTIVDGVVVAHDSGTSTAHLDTDSRSMESLFDEVEAQLAKDYEQFDIDFDAETGALNRYMVDEHMAPTDGHHGLEVLSLQKYDTEAAPTPIDLTTLVEDFSCGTGFAMGNTDQTVGLFINWTGPSDEQWDMTASIELPSANWTTEIRVGSDLFARWCGPLESSAPTPVVAERWSIVSGRLTINAHATGDSCSPDFLSGSLRDGSATWNGAQIDLPDELHLTKRSWCVWSG